MYAYHVFLCIIVLLLYSVRTLISDKMQPETTDVIDCPLPSLNIPRSVYGNGCN